jgi:very-short-patch-repair endonuclease
LIKTVDDGGGRPQIRSDAFRSDPARNVLAQVNTDAELTAWLDEVLPLPDDTPRVVSRAAALRDFGVHAIAYRLRAGQWRRLAPSVYLTSPPATPVDRMHAAALHGGSRCAISGAAALFALGFRAVRPPSAELVLVRSDSGVESWGRIRVRRTARLPRPLWRSGLPLAPVARAVADQALQLRRLDRVQAVVAEAVQRRMCDVAELAAELEAGPRQGSRLLRAALRDVGYGALSVPEAKAGRLMRKAAIAEFEQNAAVHVGGRHLVVDFLWRDLRAVLEIDSTEYHLTPADHDRTLARDQVLQAAGYAVLHVKPSQLRDAAVFVQLVRDWLAALARRTA